jgi:hypothetical protein
MLIRDDDWPSRPVALGLAVAAALWVWLAAPPAGRLRVPGWLFFLGWTLLSAGLVLCSPCRRSRSTAPASG